MYIQVDQWRQGGNSFIVAFEPGIIVISYLFYLNRDADKDDAIFLVNVRGQVATTVAIARECFESPRLIKSKIFPTYNLSVIQHSIGKQHI